MKNRVVLFICIFTLSLMMMSCTVIKVTDDTGKVSVNQNDKEMNNSQEVNTTEKSNQEISKEVLKNIMENAKTGRVINCDIKLKDNIDVVEAAWGKEDKNDYVPEAKGQYYTYLKKNIVFGCNKGMQIFEIRTFDTSIKDINLIELTNYYGKADYDIVTTNGERIIGYVVDDNFKLLFVFSNGDDKNKTLDHYSVFYPKGTVNSMAGDPGRLW